jgi:hypothetical protein
MKVTVESLELLQLNTVVGWNCVIAIVTRNGLDGPEIESWWRQDFLHPSRTALGPTQSHIQCVVVVMVAVVVVNKGEGFLDGP